MKAVFLDLQTFIKKISIDAIKQQVNECITYPLTAPCDVLSRCADADIIITNKVIITREMIARLPQLKLICVAATGTNNIDIQAANEHGVTVMNVAGYSTASVSQYVFAQLLEFFSKTAENNQNVINGQWQTSDTFCIHSSKFDELSGKTLGIVGYGDIGQQIEKIAQAFGIKVLIAERANSTTIRHGRIAFDEVLTQADIISLHCPQTNDTEQLFSSDVFDKMQSHALLINTARGPLIDNAALLDAIQNKKIGGAILDVLDQEPPSNEHILLQDQPKNLIITAHIAWSSEQAQQKLIHLIADNICTFTKNINNT